MAAQTAACAPAGSSQGSSDDHPSPGGRPAALSSSKRKLTLLDITLHELLGSGSYGMVYRATAAGELTQLKEHEAALRKEVTWPPLALAAHVPLIVPLAAG